MGGACSQKKVGVLSEQGKPGGKIHLGRPRGRWEDNIRMDLKEIDIQGAGLIRLRV